MRTIAAAAVLVLLSTAACKQNPDGSYEATTPTVDIDIGTRKDTVRAPTISTKPETVIVNKPVITPPPSP